MSNTVSHSVAGEGVVPEQKDQTQAAEAGRGVSRGPAEEERQSARESLAGGHTAGRLGRHRRHL